METLARKLLTERRIERARKAVQGKDPLELDLMDFIPAIKPGYERPEHLEPVVDVLRRAERGPVFALISAPPQHCKSDTVLAWVAQQLKRYPRKRFAIASYAMRIAQDKSRACRDIALVAGVSLREDAHAVGKWMTTAGGGVVATSIGTSFTGLPVDGALIIDDPHGDREDAESALSRQRAHDWCTSTAFPRCHPEASILVMHTRWNEDDLIARLSREEEQFADGQTRRAWEVVNLPAIREDGTALWHKRPLEFLERARRRNEYDFHSLYLGTPKPRGTSVFRGCKFYDKLPIRYRIGKGADLAYTAKTRADSSVGVVLLAAEDENGEPLYYVVDVRRAQVEAPEFVRELQAVDITWPGVWHWFCSTTEKGVAQIVSDMSGGVRIVPELATADKFVRAQPVATAWNDGRVLVPRHMAALLGERAQPEDFEAQPPWLKTFVDELGRFAGIGDRQDDQVDALASAFHTVRFSEPRAGIVEGGDGGTRYVHADGGRSFW